MLGGGGFISRITEEVRQKRGLAYSVYSYFSPYAAAGAVPDRPADARDQAEEALEWCARRWRDFVANGPDRRRSCEGAKQNIIGGFPLRIDSNRKIHDYLALIGFYRLPLTYLDDFRAASSGDAPSRSGTPSAPHRSRPHGDGGGGRRAKRREALTARDARRHCATGCASSAARGAAGLLRFPDAAGLRPTPDRVRETLFNWLGQDLTGQACLDLFAGSGALGFEAASRGARRVVMVERDPRVFARSQANAARARTRARWNWCGRMR